ncbi:hypothetical protein OTU49_001467 [Cherax quadricarinatus]|uniref:Uncharacterized protein n=1 Tax=Cherax quadricarinatus TaxID=27406 RepID=A0AAW0YA73_CHEQU
MHTHLSHAHMVLYIQLSMIILSSLSYAISYTSYTLTSHSPVIHSTFLSAFFSFIDTSLSYILVSLIHSSLMHTRLSCTLVPLVHTRLSCTHPFLSYNPSLLPPSLLSCFSAASYLLSILLSFHCPFSFSANKSLTP